MQRSFVNPAESPALNALEIGDRTWKGSNNCINRRSLFEEAQEVRANGQDSLAIKRSAMGYRSIPSRYILIAHSMGGVAAREYVQTPSIYNDDVDKVITLDSPHEGTGALNLLIDMDIKQSFSQPIIESIGQLAAGAVALGIANNYIDNPAVNQLAFYLAAGALSSNFIQMMLKEGLFVGLNFPYKKTDGLAKYIAPTKPGILSLKNRPFTENQPMFRLLYSTNALSFTDPNEGGLFYLNKVIPDIIMAPVGNAWTQGWADIPGNLRYSQAISGLLMGALFGVTVEDNGSSLIPEWSGKAKNTPSLNDPAADVKRVSYNAAIRASTYSGSNLVIGSALTAITVATMSLGWNPQAEIATKIAIIFFSGAFIAAELNDIVPPVIEDLTLSHKSPTMTEYIGKWQAPPNSYTQIYGSTQSVTPYLMEDFLYEKPFITLRVSSKNDLIETYDSANPDSIGLCKIDPVESTRCISQAVVVPTETTKMPLNFKSIGDWEKVGVKKDTWKRVPGVNNETVPVRTVNRYALPNLVVQDWIERYRFVVDDLMPNRLRQIRINFNFQEDIGWECDITKAFDVTDACDVYLRTSNGQGWQKQANKVKHPVLKDGSFDFNARDYYANLLQIQKDNQNTITITTVNKVGLTNTQRFSYLFKATANLVQPGWPLPNVAVSSINSFNLFASTLDYQGFAVQSGEDRIIPDDVDQQPTATFTPMVLAQVTDGWNATSSLAPTSMLGSRFLWNFKIHSGNGSSSDTWDEKIPFILDNVPPVISLSPEHRVLNPDSSIFMARFGNDTSVDASLRLIRMKLQKLQNGVYGSAIDLPLIFDVINPSFGVDWNGVTISSLIDGKYKLTALGLDGAAPDRSTYDAVNNVVSKANLMPSDTAFSNAWSAIVSQTNAWTVKAGLNATIDSTSFIIDRTAPTTILNPMSVLVASVDKPVATVTPVAGRFTLNKDQSLQLNYSVTEALLGRDSTPVKLQWFFRSTKDTAKAHQASDSLWVKSDASVIGQWTENSQMRIPEGDYKVQLLAKDEAGNARKVTSSTLLRIDRTAPQIGELISKQLVYSDTSKPYTATMYVSQSMDLDSNKSDLSCYYRVIGPVNQNPGWTLIGTEKNSKTKTDESSVSIDFTMTKALVGVAKGKRYLEAGCLDGAGNFGHRTDLFHVGALSPTIISPDSTLEMDQPILSIRGLAPVPTGAGLEGVAAYRLRWRLFTGTTWQTTGIDVGAGKRLLANTPWISNEAQPVEGDLGTWDRSLLLADDYMLELASRACETCAWVTDSMRVALGTLQPDTTTSMLVFSAPTSVVAGSASALISMRVESSVAQNFHGRLFAQDAQGNPLFEVSTSSLTKSQFEGTPSLAGSTDGIWFWSSGGQYHMQWKGLPLGKSITVNFKSGSLDSLCKDVANSTIAGCALVDSVLSISNVNIDSLKAILGVATSIPELQTPAGLNKAMVLSQASGHLVFRSTSVYRVDLLTLLGQSAQLELPLWLGASTQSGLLVAGTSITPTAFSVDPNLYGLRTVWNGLSTTGQYPKGGVVTLFGEAVENSADGKVLRDSTTLQVTLPNLELVSDEETPLADFFVVKDAGTNIILGNKTMTYGIHGRDASVSAWIKDASGTIVNTLLSSEAQDAAMARTAYKLSWNGTDDLGHVVTKAGAYTFVLQASERNGSQSALIQRTFTLSVAPGMTEITDGGTDGNIQSALHVAEAIDDPNNLGQKLYSPEADYLVMTNVSGKTLPDSLKSVKLQHNVVGVQEAIGYPAQRFSLAVKRHRETLDLTIAYKLKVQAHTHDCPWWGDMKWTAGDLPPLYGKFTMRATPNNLSVTERIEHSIKDTEYGLSGSPTLTVYAFLLKDSENRSAEDLATNPNDAVWSKDVVVPWTTWRSAYSLMATSNTSCAPVDPTESDSGSTCVYKAGQNGKPEVTQGYNPNEDLFHVYAIPQGRNFSDGNVFYADSGELYSCKTQDPERYQSVKLDLKLTIPLTTYWNAGFGYDNLVNRTIRFDHTNKTIFGITDGYLKALADTVNSGKLSVGYRDIIFYDGTSWKPNTAYGLLTPFEVHNFPFVPASMMSGGVNTFLFPDEDPTHMYPSYFFSKFYANSQIGENFRATILGSLSSPNTCSGSIDIDGRCKVVMKSTDNIPTTGFSTPLFQHGSVNVMVSLDAKPSDFTTNKYSSKYPAGLNWKPADVGTMNTACPEVNSNNASAWRGVQTSQTTCGKFYHAGSMVHFYVNDFNNASWNESMQLNNGTGVLRNIMNTPGLGLLADNIYTVFPLMDEDLVGSTAVPGTNKVSLSATQYADGKFYLKEAQLGRPPLSNNGLNTSITTSVEGVDQRLYNWNATTKRMEFPAVTWSDPALISNQIVYRRTLGSGLDTAIPIKDFPTEIGLEALYSGQVGIQSKAIAGKSLYSFNTSTKSWSKNGWVQEIALSSPRTTHLDSSDHTHFTASLGLNKIVQSLNINRITPLGVIRPKELVAIEGRVPISGTKYQLSYVKNGEFNTIKSGTMGEPKGSLPFLSWFDVNHLQGNTSLMLSWGGIEGKQLNFRKLDLNIGSPQKGSGVVTSLFGELTVNFPQGSLSERKDVTVRTVDPKEYNFTTFNNAPLRGPVMEVLPSMQFTAPNYPRVKMQIARSELGELAQDPSRVRLYKVDFANKQFIPLQTVLYGYLKADGSAMGVKKECEQWKNPDCYTGDDWAYLLVSGEAHTFSSFVAMDYQTLPQRIVNLAVSPEIGTGLIREISVTGTSEYNVYADDDSLWANTGDATNHTALSVVVGSDGKSRVTLPNRLDSWLFLVPKLNGVELAGAPIMVHVQVVPDNMLCRVPDTTLWLGLDNGYLEFPQSCNQTGMGLLQLRKSGSVFAEEHKAIPDTIRWDGSLGLNKLAQGIYTTRYLGVAVTGAEEQQAGPEIRTDSYRPTLSGWSVSESSMMLDREYTVSATLTDDLSGFGKVQLSWMLGAKTLGSVLLSPNTLGIVSHQIIVPRSALLNCEGCKVTISLHAEDKGHNFVDTSWKSGRVWPYPSALALWYPAQEGSGTVVPEKTGTGHDLNLSMAYPWLAASGLYFYQANDKAVGNGQVDLGMTNAYTLEAWVRPGYVSGTEWKRLLGFVSNAGVKYELQAQGGSIRLVDGSDNWSAAGVLTQAKVWTHLAVTINSTTVKFYKDGQLVYTGVASEKQRNLAGVFSLGGAGGSAFVGHLSQVRMYLRDLNADEIRGLFQDIGSDGQTHTEIALANEMTGGSGVELGFSCAAPGSNYWTATAGVGNLTLRAWVDQGSSYKVIVYARSTVSGVSTAKVGVDGQSLQAGTLNLETVWRPLILDGITLSLVSGYNNLNIQLPQGMQIAGIALTDDAMAIASRISWKSTDPVVVSSGMSTKVKFEGYPDVSMLRPRMQLTNTGLTTINGFKVRYYFRGEDPSQVHVSAFYPQDGSGLSVFKETDQVGYAEWQFPEISVAPGQSPFWGSGPHFGLYNTGNIPWLAMDDPSFVENAATTFLSASGIIVLDNGNKVLNGSCFEDEKPVSTIPVVRVVALDSRAGDVAASQLYIKLENIGQVALKDYEVRYSFYVPKGVEPNFDVYDMQGLTATRVDLGSGHWQISIRGAVSIGPGNSWSNPAQFALHLPGWQAGWDVSDDPSHIGLTKEWSLASGIEVFDALGNRIYGKAPVWTSVVVSSSSTSGASSSSGASSTTSIARVMAKENKINESNSSAVRLLVENQGANSLTNFEMRYWFMVENGKNLDYQLSNNNQATVTKVSEGGNLFSMRFKYSGVSLPAGGKTDYGDGVELFLHYSDWSNWTKSKDYSHSDIGTSFAEAHYVTLYDGNGNLIWGVEPTTPNTVQAPSVQITKTPEGMILHLLEPATIRADLVNVIGLPVKFIYSGQLTAGDQFLRVDWTGIDQSTTYLMVRLNGQIVTTKLISQLGS